MKSRLDVIVHKVPWENDTTLTELPHLAKTTQNLIDATVPSLLERFKI